MTELRELYDTISEKMVYDDAKWENFRNSLNSSLKKQFFELFEKGYTEREIAHELFHAEISIAPHRNTKHEIKTALQNELLKFNPPNYHYTGLQQAYYKALKQFAIFKTLIGLGRNHSLLDLGENLLKRAATYDFTDIVVEVSKQLFLYYSVKEIDPNRVEAYIRLHRRYSRILQKETSVEIVWARIASLSSGNSTNHELALTIAKEYLDKNELPATPIKSSRFYLRHYLIMVYHSELKKEYRTVEKISREAYEYFCSISYEHKLA